MFLEFSLSSLKASASCEAAVNLFYIRNMAYQYCGHPVLCVMHRMQK